MAVVAEERKSVDRKSLPSAAREAMERLNAEAAGLNIWLRTQANAPSQRPWFRETGLDVGGQLAVGRVGANQMKAAPHRWRWREIAPYLDRIAEIARNADVPPIEFADRQQFLLTNPGLGGRLQVTSTIRCAVSIYNSGDVAPVHVHAPNASRTILSEKGGYTTIEGERCIAERGDLILTPNGTWHDHGNDDAKPVVWADILDFPLLEFLDCSWIDEEFLGEREGNEFRYSDLIAETFGTDHHRIHIPTDRMLPALDGAIAAMSEPMVSHDAVAFYLLSQEVSKSLKVVQSGQGADEVFAGYSWYPPVHNADGNGADAYQAAFFDRPDAEMAQTLATGYRLSDDPSRAFLDRHFAAPGADDPLDRALRLDVEVMLVDDPVKRVDNMTMAWGLEARTPFLDHELVELAAVCPPELKLASGGKGVLKEAGRRVLPAEVIDRPKGYFPVPALSTLEGATLELIRETMEAPDAAARGLFEPGHVQRLLAAPNEHLTTLEGSKLWQLALLELWLQRHGI